MNSLFHQQRLQNSSELKLPRLKIPSKPLSTLLETMNTVKQKLKPLQLSMELSTSQKVLSLAILFLATAVLCAVSRLTTFLE